MLRGAAEEQDRKGSERKKLMVNIIAIVLNHHQAFHSEVSSSVLKELVRRALQSGQIYCLEDGQVLLHQVDELINGRRSNEMKWHGHE